MRSTLMACAASDAGLLSICPHAGNTNLGMPGLLAHLGGEGPTSARLPCKHV